MGTAVFSITTATLITSVYVLPVLVYTTWYSRLSHWDCLFSEERAGHGCFSAVLDVYPVAVMSALAAYSSRLLLVSQVRMYQSLISQLVD